MAEEKKIETGYIGNALRSAAADHTTTFADEIFDTERQKYQNEVNADLETTDNEIKADLETESSRAKAAEQAIIFDVSAYNDGAFFESISALLGNSNLDTLIPVSFRHGGMTIRFIQGSEQSSDNKYVQYRLTSDTFTITTSDWQKQGAEVSVSQNTSTQKEVLLGTESQGMFAEGAIGEMASRAVLGSEMFDASDVPSGNIGKAYRLDTRDDFTAANYFIFDISVEGGKAYNLSGGVSDSEWALSHFGYNFENSDGHNIGIGAYVSPINNVIVTPADCTKIHLSALYTEIANISFREILTINGVKEVLSAFQNRQDAELLNGIFGDNIFSTLSKSSGEAWRATNNSWQIISGYGYFDLEVNEGEVYYISGYSSSIYPFGFRANSKVGSVLVDSFIITEDFYYIVPSGVKQLQITYKESDTISVQKIIVKDGFTEIQNQIDNNKDNVPLKIKDFNDDTLYLDGYYYLAFFGGICFSGKEYHCGRIGRRHTAQTGFYGHLAMFEIDANGNKRYFDPINDYSVFDGELFDINLSKTRDGQYMILSAGCASENDEIINSYLIFFDTSLNIVKTIDLWDSGMDGYFAWGNTLETPDHYLLKCGYKQVDGYDSVSLFKSNEKITDTITLTFSKIHTFGNVGSGINEATIGYVGNLLCFITRANSSNARMCFTETLDGTGSWDSYIDLGHDLHSPCIPLYQHGNIFAFGGGYINGVPGSGGTRNPFIAYFDATSKQLLNITQIDTLTGWGGYPSMVNIGEDRYAMMYYDDYQNARTAVYYQRVNVRYKCNVDFIL